MKSGLRPYSFSVFIARRSGLRSRRDPQIGRREKELFHSDLMELAQTRRVCGDAELEVAQLALRRSLHLVSEMARITDVAPEAAAMAGRSVVEQALVGSYLALYRAPGGGVAGLLKRQRGYAGKLREHFLKGDMVGALALLPKVSFVAAPLSSDLGSVTGAPDLRNICSLLDEKEPFKSGNLATLIYYDVWLKEVNSIDGYEWSGSVARMAAVEGLTELVGLPSVYALNAAGFAVRALATADVMISSPPATQLIAACEILDRAKARQRWPKLQPFRLVSALLLLSRTHSSRDSDETTKITSGHA